MSVFPTSLASLQQEWLSLCLQTQLSIWQERNWRNDSYVSTKDSCNSYTDRRAVEKNIQTCSILGRRWDFSSSCGWGKLVLLCRVGSTVLGWGESEPQVCVGKANPSVVSLLVKSRCNRGSCVLRTRVNVKEIGPKQIDEMSENSFIENFSLACRALSHIFFSTWVEEKTQQNKIIHFPLQHYTAHLKWNMTFWVTSCPWQRGWF